MVPPVRCWSQVPSERTAGSCQDEILGGFYPGCVRNDCSDKLLMAFAERRHSSRAGSSVQKELEREKNSEWGQGGVLKPR